MNQLGLTKEQFEDVQFEILKIRLMKEGTLEEIQDKLKAIIIQPFVLVKRSDYESAELVYNAVRYYINFVDIMYSSLNRDICSMLAAFIKEKLGKNINKVEKIVVSENGNFLLGLGVSEELNKAFVKMLPEPRIIKKQYWEGTFKSDENIIIVHDVLVTAKQIIESIEHFPSPHKNIGIFCLVNRTDHEGKKELNNKGIEVFAILELSDNDIGMMFINNKTKEGV